MNNTLQAGKPGGYRAISDTQNPLVMTQNDLNYQINGLIQGRGQLRELFGELIIPGISTPSANFQWNSYDHQSLVEHVTQIGTRDSAWHTANVGWEVKTGKLSQYAIAMIWHKIERQNSEGFAAATGGNVQLTEEGLYTQARDIVRLTLEKIRQRQVVDVANYDPALITTLAGGSEVDVIGGGRAHISTAVQSLLAFHPGVRREDLTLNLTNRAFEAALADPDLATDLINSTIDFPDQDLLRRYYGVGAVVTGDAIESADPQADTVPGSLWGSIAYLTVPQANNQESPLSVTNDTIHVAQFSIDGAHQGEALNVWEKELAWEYPWLARTGFELVSNTSAYLIQNWGSI